MEKKITVKMATQGTAVEVLHEVRNAGAEPHHLAPWILTMMAQGGAGIHGFPPRGTHPEMLEPAEVGTLQPPHLGRLPAQRRTVREALRGDRPSGSLPGSRLHLRDLYQRGLPGIGNAGSLDHPRTRAERVAHRALDRPPRCEANHVDRRRTGRCGAAPGVEVWTRTSALEMPTLSRW